MIEATKHDVVIDHCPTCGGIWLDKGELGKIINQMKEAEASLDQEFRTLRPKREDHHRGYYEKDQDDHYRYKKKSTFGKLFDIFD
jgi:Zn-finger nucleic acid-binding protein